MSDRAQKLANEFEGVIKEFTAAIEQCSDEQWRSTCGDGGWTVAATAQHVAGQFPLEMEYLNAASEGRDMPSYSWDDINALNERRAAAMRDATKPEVLRLLSANATAAAAWLRSLSDQQLDRKFPLPLANGAEVRTQDLVEGGVLIDHARAHLKVMQEAGVAVS